MRRFVGKTVLVTGAAHGIGAATALRFAGEGAGVVLADIDDPAGESLAREIAAAGGRALYCHCDVARRAEWERVVEETMSEFGALDVVHNNAYVLELALTHELAEESWDRQLAVGVKQIFHSVQTCMQHLQAAKGAMINTSSIHAIMGFARQAAYDASKGAVSALTRALAVEYAPDVRVNAVMPGGILTAAWDRVTSEDIAEFVGATPAQRLGRPEEIAAAVCFLASEDASFITGENLVVDGGYTITKG